MEPCLGNLTWFGQEPGQREEFRSPVLVDLFHFFSTTPCVMCSVSYIVHNMEFGEYLRKRREELKREDPQFSVRRVAGRIGVEPSYLSKIERSLQPPPSEQTTRALAEVLDEDADFLLALAGKVSSDLAEIIRSRPRLFADLLRQLKDMPDHAVLRVVREVRDGEW